MPGAVFPNAALLAELDLRGLAGEVVLRRAGMGNLTLASDVGRFRDLRHLLNAYGTRSTMQDKLTAAGTGASTWTRGMTEATDRINITSSGASAEGFTVQASPAWGFTSATPAIQVGSDWVATAPADWQRGRVTAPSLTITPSVSAEFTVNSDLAWADSLVHLMRKRGTIADADDLHATECLEHHDPLYVSDAEEVRWGLGFTLGDGLVWCAYNEGAGDPFMFPDTTAGRAFRKLLGFDGLNGEWVDAAGAAWTAGDRYWRPTSTTADGITYQVGDHPPPSVLPLRKPLARWLRGRAYESAGGIAGGQGYGLDHNRWRPWSCRVEYGSTLHQHPLEQHLLAPGGFLDQAPPYSPLTVQPELGDPRRGSDDRTIGYTVLYTTEDFGRRGRRICTLMEDLGEVFADYGDEAVEFIGELDFTVVEDPNG